ncbi:MAG: DUF4981 domain-containing protein, partial [Oscillospiraceae bacterium]|nr:DUF4981 domain-containing protein [Oscillospiraceae bacterium]
MNHKSFRKVVLLILLLTSVIAITIFGNSAIPMAATITETTYVRVSQLSEIDPAEDYVIAIDNVIPLGASGSDPEMMVAVMTGKPADWSVNLNYEPFGAEKDASYIGLVWRFEPEGSGYRIKVSGGGTNDYMRETTGPAVTLGAAQTLYLTPASDPANGDGFRIRTGAASGNYLAFSNSYNPGGGNVSAFVFASGTTDSVFRFYKVVEQISEVIDEPDFSGNEWNTNTVYAVNKEEPHANFIAYDNEADAKEYFTLYKEESNYYYSLDGTWKFRWDHNPANRRTEANTPGFTTVGFNDSAWDDTKVPLNWQANFNPDGTFKYDGYIFMTSGTAWGGSYRNPLTGSNVTNSATQPAAPANYNPVATYRKKFTIPQQWKDENRSVFVLFDGVGANCYVWVNGYQVGYAEDSFTQKDFDITPYVNYDEENVITVQVFRWCAGSWFELQDMNRLSGIFRSVGLVARAKVNLYDFQTLTTPVATGAYSGNWNLNIRALLRDFGATQSQRNNARLEAKLYDANDAVVGTVASTTAPSFTTRQNSLNNSYSGADVNLNMVVTTPKLWSAEHPNLYKLVLTLYDGGKATEITCIRIGFREVRIVNNYTSNVRFQINGSRILMNGVNQHESNPESGFTQNLDLIREDIVLMKQNNVNAFRMSHYPHDTRYYDLCDEYGLYVMDESNTECHGATSVVGSLAVVNAWGPSLRDRVNSMMQRDWNYPCVISWSMGNENNSVNSAAQTAYHDWTTHYAKAKDPSRPIHAQYLQNGSTSTSTAGPDWYSGMYATASSWQSTVNSALRITVQCEYAHAYGNSLGNFDEYMTVFESPRTSGGFIWDWVDQGLWMAVPNKPGERYLSFGGDWNGTWGTASHSGNLMCNGLITADRVPNPEVEQMKYGYRMLKASNLNLTAGTYAVSNKFIFTNANEYDMYWELKEDGKVIQSGNTVLDVAPAPAGVST